MLEHGARRVVDELPSVAERERLAAERAPVVTVEDRVRENVEAAIDPTTPQSEVVRLAAEEAVRLTSAPPPQGTVQKNPANPGGTA